MSTPAAPTGVPWPGLPAFVEHLNFLSPSQGEEQTVELEVALAAAREQVAKFTGRTGADDEVVPASLRWATLIVGQHLWEAQRGAAAQGFEVAPRGFGMPNRAWDIMRPYLVVGVV